MKVYEFGKKENPVLLLLPGTGCHWKVNYGHVIDLLSRNFLVACVSYDGFDETEDTIFSTMLEETERIEEYIKKKYHGAICCAYGCSLGGSFVGLLAYREKIHMDFGILGSSDLDSAGIFSAHLQTAVMVPVLYALLSEKETLLKRISIKITDKIFGGKDEETNAYRHEVMKLFTDSGMSGNHISKQSLKNQFYSDLITVLPNKINPQNTQIHIFYATKMGNKYEDRYLKHFAHPIIHRHNMMHEELLMLHKEKWVELIEKICNMDSEKYSH